MKVNDKYICIKEILINSNFTIKSGNIFTIETILYNGNEDFFNKKTFIGRLNTINKFFYLFYNDLKSNFIKITNEETAKLLYG